MYELRSENATKHFYPKELYMDQLSWSKSQLFPYGERKWWFL